MVKIAQLCLTLCDPMDCGLPGSSIHVIFQAIVLEWIVISFSRELPTQGSNLGLPHCRQTVNCLSHQGSLIRCVQIAICLGGQVKDCTILISLSFPTFFSFPSRYTPVQDISLSELQLYANTLSFHFVTRPVTVKNMNKNIKTFFSTCQ